MRCPGGRSIGRVLCTVSLAGIGLVVAATGASAETDYLGELSVPDQGFGILTDTSWLVAEFTVTGGQTVTGGTAVVTVDPATSAGKELVLYSAAAEAALNWPDIGTFAQSSFAPAPDIAPSRWRVTFTGSVALAPGVYFVGVRATGPGGGLDLNLAQGPQSSPWTYTNTGAGFQQYVTLDSGANWADNDFGSVGAITLFGASPSSQAGPPPVLPPPRLQQVALPDSGRCADVADAELAWGSGVSGGWGDSWAAWRGGPVCTRTLTHVAGEWRLA